jgi:PAS domain S-box-containing protein
MKTAFIGAGRGCRAVLELFVQGTLGISDLQIAAVTDIDLEAPGFRFAADRGWPTLTSIEDTLALPELELVIELTGSDQVLDQIYAHLRPGVRVMDHVMARVFWDLERSARNQREQLQEKERLESERAQDHEELRKIIDTIPDMVIVLDREMRIVRVNQRFEQVTGLSRTEAEQLFYRQAFSLTNSNDNPVDLVSPFYSVIETKKPATVIQNNETHDGREAYFQVTAHPILNDAAEVSRVVQTAQEVTELVMLQRGAAEQDRRFRQIVNAVHGIITIKDLAGRYQLVNPRAERFFELSQAEMVGRRAEELFEPQTAATIMNNDEAARVRGKHQTTEELLLINGRERVLVAERFPLLDYKGQVAALCCVARDVTQARQLNRELIRSERLAAVGKLAAGVAHELNNPLTGILTFAEDLLLEAAPNDPSRADYELIVNEAMRCRRIVRDLLEYSRQKTPDRNAVPIEPVIQRVLTMVGRQASFHNIRFDVQYEPRLPLVSIDATQIHQAILNLVINARDAMLGCGPIVINVATPPPEHPVVIAITDEGCGIPEEIQHDIFEPFFSTKGEQGNGLGLPAVQSLAEQNGGRVEFTSTLGRGSTFRLILPRALV